MRRPHRRTVLASIAGIGLAGCLDSGDSADGTPGTGSDGSSIADDTGTATPPPDETPTQSDTPETTPDQGDDQSGDDADDDSEDNEEPDPSVFPGYEMTTVEVETPDGDDLGQVYAAIADTRDLRYTGLSDTDSMPENYGMLFVFDDVDDRPFVMREMDFGIDIVYADDEGVITSIHHAPAPGPEEDGSEQTYPGRGQYVLEVNYEWTSDREIEAGDRLAFEL
jgi:uncharacterized membrane protein (UPF0127 family)